MCVHPCRAPRPGPVAKASVYLGSWTQGSRQRNTGGRRNYFTFYLGIHLQRFPHKTGKMSFLKKLKRGPSSAKTVLNEKVGDLESAKAKLEEDVEKYKSEIETYKSEAEGYKKQAEEVQVKAEEKVKVAKEEVETVKKDAEETKTGLLAEIAKYKKMAEDALKQVSDLKGQLSKFTGEGLGNLKDMGSGALAGGIGKLGL